MQTYRYIPLPKEESLQYRSYPVICEESGGIVFKECLGNTSAIATTSGFKAILAFN